MNIPIVCPQGHRFAVAQVTPDLRCRCGSTDLDLDDTLAVTAISVGATCSVCGKTLSDSEVERLNEDIDFIEHDGHTIRVEAKTAAKGPLPAHLQGFWGGNRTDVRDKPAFCAQQSHKTPSIPWHNGEPCLSCGKARNEWLKKSSKEAGAGDNASERECSNQRCVDYGVRVEDTHTHRPAGKDASKTADFTDPEMALLDDTEAVKQTVTCSTCLTDAIVTASDPTQPLPICPNCGADTLSAAGGTLASLRSIDATFDNPTPNCLTIMQLQSDAYDALDIEGFSGDPNDPVRLECIQWIKDRIKGLTITQEDLDSLEDNNAHAGGEAAEQIMKGASLRPAPPDWWPRRTAAFGYDSSEEPCCYAYVTSGGQDHEPGCIVGDKMNDPGHSGPIKSSARSAKIAQIARGIRATNPGMSERVAHRVAYRTVMKYPKTVGKGN